MERILETEIMEDKDQILAYAKADFSDSVNLFVKLFLEKFASAKRILDIGCGTADVPICLVENNNISIVAVDGSREMIKYARKKVLSNPPNIKNGKITFLNKKIQEISFNEPFDAVISKDLLHHLEDPMIFWSFIKNNFPKGTSIFCMDLIRLNPEKANKMVEKIAKDADPVLKTDFFNSLLASFTLKEIKEQLKKAGLNLLVYRSQTKRHFIVEGVI